MVIEISAQEKKQLLAYQSQLKAQQTPDFSTLANIDSHIGHLITRFDEGIQQQYAINLSMTDGTMVDQQYSAMAALITSMLESSTVVSEFVVEESEDDDDDDVSMFQVRQWFEEAIGNKNLERINQLFAIYSQMISPNTYFKSGVSAIAMVLIQADDNDYAIFTYFMRECHPDLRLPLLAEGVSNVDAVCLFGRQNLIEYTIDMGSEFIAEELLNYCSDQLKPHESNAFKQLLIDEDDDDEEEQEQAMQQMSRACSPQALIKRQWQQRIFVQVKQFIPRLTTIANDALNVYLYQCFFQQALQQNILLLSVHGLGSLALEPDHLSAIIRGEKKEIAVQTVYGDTSGFEFINIENKPVNKVIIPVCLGERHYGVLVLVCDQGRVSSAIYFEPKLGLLTTWQSIIDNLIPNLNGVIDPKELKVAYMLQLNDVDCGVYVMAIIKKLLDTPDCWQSLEQIFAVEQYIADLNSYAWRCHMASILGIDYFKKEHGENNADQRFQQLEQFVQQYGPQLMRLTQPTNDVSVQAVAMMQEQLFQQQLLAQFQANKKGTAGKTGSSMPSPTS